MRRLPLDYARRRRGPPTHVHKYTTLKSLNDQQHALFCDCNEYDPGLTVELHSEYMEDILEVLVAMDDSPDGLELN